MGDDNTNVPGTKKARTRGEIGGDTRLEDDDEIGMDRINTGGPSCKAKDSDLLIGGAEDS